MNDEPRLCCPDCARWDALALIETTEIYPILGEITMNHIERLGNLLTDAGNLLFADREVIGVTCFNCGFRHIGDDFKLILKKEEEK